MLKQKVEVYKLTGSFKKDDSIQQINDIIEKLNSEGKRVVSLAYGLGQTVTFLCEYEG